MLYMENHIGKITISDAYLRELTRQTVTQCFGIAGLAEPSLTERLITGRQSAVSVITRDGKLEIAVHVSIMYGVNIPAVVNSMMHKLEFAVEDAVRIPVSRVRVFVDEILEP